MGADPKRSQISTVLVDDSFANEDDQFVDRLRRVTAAKYLAGLADRWKKDPRPWARRQICDYLALPLDRPGHHPLVKRLFKEAEARQDHELMAAFLVAFDRLIRRQRRLRSRYNYQTRQSWQEEQLFSPHDQILPAKEDRTVVNPRTGQLITVPGASRIPRNGRLFSYRTRGYLRRRANRYFRRLGFQQPAEYPQAVAAALARYRDADVAKGENILDNWSLMHIAFRRSPVLLFKRTRVEVADGRSLGELVAAPAFEEEWKQPASGAALLKLVTQAESRLVRVWAIQLLKRDHAATLRAVAVEQLLALLDHADQEVQQFGAGILETVSGVESWPISVWMQLLETRSVTALATICQAMSQRVSPERLSLEQCVSLACARPTPVARLGLSWLASRSVASDTDRTTILRLADAQCEAVGAEVAEYALSILGSRQAYRMEEVSPFFDSLNAQVRRGAWSWNSPESPGYDDAALWSRLLETPYDDVRLRLVDELNKRTREAVAPPALRARERMGTGSELDSGNPGKNGGREVPVPILSHPLRRQDLSTVWTTVLLGIHRGGRAKLTALRQISAAIAEQPDRAERLIPVLAVAIRSVRPPEIRAGLSAILSAVSVRPELETLLATCIPELRLTPVQAAP